MADQAFASRIARIEAGRQWEPAGVVQARRRARARRRGIALGYWFRYTIAVGALAAVMAVLIEAGAIPELAEAAEAAGHDSILAMIAGV